MTIQEQCIQYLIQNPKATPQDIMGAIGCQKSAAYAAWSSFKSVNQMSDTMTAVGMGDLHCGHIAGLTPPRWMTNKHNAQLYAEQKESWEAYESWIDLIGPVDALMVNGDCIDGKGKRSGSSELITADRLGQADMAAECIKQFKAKKVYMSKGTPYHTGDGEDFEQVIADKVGAVISDQIWVSINGIVFNLKHKIGSSSIPHGRATSLSKEWVWNTLWDEISGAPKADVFLRSHVHYHTFVGNSQYLAMTLPALQASNTKFGARQCSGTVDFGLVEFKIKEGDTVNTMTWKPYIKRLEAVAPTLLVA